MSYTLATVRRKIRNTEDMRSVVKMMKAMATGSLVQFKQAVIAMEEYRRTVELALSACLKTTPEEVWENDTFPGTKGWIVWGTDQGMVGRFNEQMAEEIQTRAGQEKVRLWIVGDRLRFRLEQAGMTVVRSFPSPQSVEAIGTLVSNLLLEVEREQISGLAQEIGYCHHGLVMRGNYETRWGRLLPCGKVWRDRLLNIPWPTKQLPEMLESGGASLTALISESLFVTLFQACAESCMAENSARLAAMYRAEDNIDERRQELDLDFNHRRQSAIDEELFDVIAGYEARGGRAVGR